MNTEHIYEAGLGKNQANYTPLSPLTFIERAASVYPDYVSVVHGETRFTWAETYCPLPAPGIGPAQQGYR